MKTGTAILALVLAVWVAYDLWRAVGTGRARGRSETITRKSRPKMFQWYIIGDVAVLAFCIGAIFFGLPMIDLSLPPHDLRRRPSRQRSPK